MAFARSATDFISCKADSSLDDLDASAFFARSAMEDFLRRAAYSACRSSNCRETSSLKNDELLLTAPAPHYFFPGISSGTSSSLNNADDTLNMASSAALTVAWALRLTISFDPTSSVAAFSTKV